MISVQLSRSGHWSWFNNNKINSSDGWWQNLSVEEIWLELILHPDQRLEGAEWIWLQGLGQQWFKKYISSQNTDIVFNWNDFQVYQFVNEAPWFKGAEFLTVEVLRNSIIQLEKKLLHLRGKLSLKDWLKVRRSPWQVSGQITFHLAENKSQSELPFVFMVTQTDGVNAQGQPKYVPLSRALQKIDEMLQPDEVAQMLKPLSLAFEVCPWLKLMMDDGSLFKVQTWTARQAYDLLRYFKELEACGILLRVPDWWQKRVQRSPKIQVTLQMESSSVKTTSHGLPLIFFKCQYTLDGELLTAEEIHQLQENESGLISLKGKWAELNQQQWREACRYWAQCEVKARESGMTFHEAMRYLAGVYIPTGAEAALLSSSVNLSSMSEVKLDETFEKEWQRLVLPDEIELPKTLQATLRPYQLKGVQWMIQLHHLGLGGCLADDMGLGKTLQVIAYLEYCRVRSNSPLRVLIVTPASLLGNWLNEFERFAPLLRVKVIHHQFLKNNEIEMIQSYDDLSQEDVILVTYSYVLRNEWLIAGQWNAVILDEAQAIKNPFAKQTQAVKQLQGRFKLVLSGTPVENQALDLWSLFDFINPGLLGNLQQFQQYLQNAVSKTEPYAAMKRLISPYVLRRMKSDPKIIQDLPDKTEVKVACAMSKKQMLIYHKLVKQLEKGLSEQEQNQELNRRQGLILSYLIQFKQVCNHPAQWSGSGDYIPAESGKWLRLKQLTEQIKDKQEKMLVFTQFQEMCQPLVDALTLWWGCSGLILHGSIPISQRRQAVARFQEEEGPPFFVISLKAGGTGLTLTRANHVIHFDRWWNPAIENQATDRAYRIGQHRNVLVHKMVVKGTIEDRIDQMIDRKKALAEQLLSHDEEPMLGLAQMSNTEILDLLHLNDQQVLSLEEEFIEG
jgi:non-specific serine/threonine protein kinase